MASYQGKSYFRSGDTAANPILINEDRDNSVAGGTSADPIILDDDGEKSTSGGVGPVAVAGAVENEALERHISLPSINPEIPPGQTVLPIQSSCSLQRSPVPTDETYDKFTLFPKLPLELRCMVWKWTFPGPRTVSLNILNLKNEDREAASALNSEIGDALPVALQVNLESRREAQRRYSVWKRKYVDKILVVSDPARDRISISFYPLRGLSTMLNWVNSDRAHLLFFTNIRSLDIYNTPAIRFTPHYKLDWKSDLEGLGLFVGLKELRVTFQRDNLNLRRLYEDALELCQEAFEAILEEHKNLFDAKRAPRVVVRYWEDHRTAVADAR